MLRVPAWSALVRASSGLQMVCLAYTCLCVYAYVGVCVYVREREREREREKRERTSKMYGISSYKGTRHRLHDLRRSSLAIVRQR
jgi:hypothetical protein